MSSVAQPPHDHAAAADAREPSGSPLLDLVLSAENKPWLVTHRWALREAADRVSLVPRRGLNPFDTIAATVAAVPFALCVGLMITMIVQTFVPPWPHLVWAFPALIALGAGLLLRMLGKMHTREVEKGPAFTIDLARQHITLDRDDLDPIPLREIDRVLLVHIKPARERNPMLLPNDAHALLITRRPPSADADPVVLGLAFLRGTPFGRSTLRRLSKHLRKPIERASVATRAAPTFERLMEGVQQPGPIVIPPRPLLFPPPRDHHSDRFWGAV